MHVTFSHSSSYAEFSGHAHTAEVSFKGELGYHEVECRIVQSGKPYLRNMDSGEVFDIEAVKVGGIITVPAGTYTVYYGSDGISTRVTSPSIQPRLSSKPKPPSPWYRRFAK